MATIANITIERVLERQHTRNIAVLVATWISRHTVKKGKRTVVLPEDINGCLNFFNRAHSSGNVSISPLRGNNFQKVSVGNHCRGNLIKQEIIIEC